MDFERVYQELFTPLYRYVVIRVRNDHEALDIVQEVFTRVYQKYTDKSYDELSKLLYQSARNAIIDRSRKPVTFSLDAYPGMVESITDNQSDPEQTRKEIDNRAWVQQILDQLEEVDREIVILRYFQELDYETIARRVEMNQVAVRKRLSRALQKMSEYMKHE